ncbi:hypothetical protein ACO0LG_12155 [Undibacterium sp. Ji42W]|uniref:hypothetical protein n=1 Tax=Undibacterium sp. Ji42W TaxID=3413039 RepID=UPI003BF2F8E9
MAAGKQEGSDSAFVTIENTCQHWQHSEFQGCSSRFLAYHLSEKMMLLKCQALKK